ncbi:BC1872 family protein [Paenibacillus odorifer]|uniref:Phage ABA sandwich domain-containing protein n=1 Tax=Paenibacillus odorifer TaxID=189426 RepID=A0A1R0Y1F7_9BACL|nr:hypothetical protein [Paenibacillus odorifer]OMD41117.1 hypothetical protein BSK52_11850 [Paenibacillus odorifer]
MDSLNWLSLSYEEKDKIIAQEVLDFNCFNSAEGTYWFQKHYDLGLWRFTNNLQDATKVLDKMGESKLKANFLMLSPTQYQCSFYDNDLDIESMICSETLADAICLAAITYKKKSYKSSSV